jgi:cAMP-specific phosphodiesterase 4/high affinity cAMP-specific and IBMX-insensitive 3',5'-cyclic phosphodiesterase 8
MGALEAANHWQFDAFRLSDVTDGHPLSALGFYAFQEANLVAKFSLPPVKLARFLRMIEDGYSDSNPYQ